MGWGCGGVSRSCLIRAWGRGEEGLTGCGAAGGGVQLLYGGQGGRLVENMRGSYMDVKSFFSYKTSSSIQLRYICGRE